MKATPFGYFIIVGCIFLTASVTAQQPTALSTSVWIPVSYIEDGKVVATCSGKKAVFGRNYVSIGVNKFTVNKKDPLLTTIFNKDRRAFGVANFKGAYQGQNISISRVGHPVALSGSNSSIDLGVEWSLINKVPWVISDASLNIRLGYAADSSVDSMIEAFSGVTEAIPDYTISTSVAAGMAITSAIDKLIFASDRSRDLLSATRDLPLVAKNLCEGHYVIYAAKDKSTYEKIYGKNVVWTGSTLEADKVSITEVSYAVIGVRVSDEFYEPIESAMNDDTKPWASKYQIVRNELFNLSLVYDKTSLKELTNKIRDGLLEARTLLNADTNILQSERNKIHKSVIDESELLIASAEKRLDERGRVTVDSTKIAINSLINSDVSLSENDVQLVGQILANPEVNIPLVEKGFESDFRSALKETRAIMGIE